MNKTITAVAAVLLLASSVLLHTAESAEPDQRFNRAPLQSKPYSELPLGTIKPEDWLREELQRMASGMTGHLDEWYPEVCGDRNAWLGGDGDTWDAGRIGLMVYIRSCACLMTRGCRRRLRSGWTGPSRISERTATSARWG